MNKIAMHTRSPSNSLKETQQQNISHKTKNLLSYKKGKTNILKPPYYSAKIKIGLQPKRILRRLPIAPNPLATRQVLVLHILLVTLPLVRVLRDFLHAFGGFAGGTADGACDVADGGLEGFVEDLADWVADDAEETLGLLLVGGGGEDGG